MLKYFFTMTTIESTMSINSSSHLLAHLIKQCKKLRNRLYRPYFGQIIARILLVKSQQYIFALTFGQILHFAVNIYTALFHVMVNLLIRTIFSIEVITKQYLLEQFIFIIS